MHSCYSQTGYNWNTVNTHRQTGIFLFSLNFLLFLAFSYYLVFLLYPLCNDRKQQHLCKLLCRNERWGLDQGRGRWDARGWHWMVGLNEGRVQGDEQRIERGSMAGISRKVLWKETEGEILRGGSHCGFIVASCNDGGGQEQGLLDEGLINFYRTVIKSASYVCRNACLCTCLLLSTAEASQWFILLHKRLLSAHLWPC